jgi:hypothetical protein
MNLFQTISILSHVDIREQEVQQCAQALEQIKNDRTAQHAFFVYCKQWKMAPWVFVQLKKHQLLHYLGKETQHLFSTFHTKIKRENEDRNQVAIQFLSEFRKHEIEVVVLKGNLFTQTVYQDVGYKKMNDFDILAHQKDWPRIQEIYANLGYIPMGFGWDGEKQEPTKFSHTGIPFISPDFKCIIGTQWGLKSPTTKYRVDMDELWNTVQPFDFHGVACKQLSPEYNLLHLVLHLGVYKCGIRDCMDLYNLITTQTWDDQKLMSVFKKANAMEKARFAFEMCRLSSNRIPDQWIDGLQFQSQSFLQRRTTKRKALFQRTGDIHPSYNDYFQDIEKNVLFLNIFPRFHDKLKFYFRILRLIYLPTTEQALKFIDASDKPTLLNRLKARLLGPYFSFSLIAQEIGWTVTILLFIKLFIDVLISPVNYLFQKESYYEFLERKGVDPENIKRIVKNVQ